MRTLLTTVALALAACNGDPSPKKTAEPTHAASGTAGASGTNAAGGAAAGSALPADQQCLWLNVCDKWTGCAHIAQAGAAWKVITAEGFAAGDKVDVLDMCSGEPVCISASGIPKGVICPPHTTTIFIPEPDYTCAWTGSACASQPKAAKVTP